MEKINASGKLISLLFFLSLIVNTLPAVSETPQISRCAIYSISQKADKKKKKEKQTPVTVTNPKAYIKVDKRPEFKYGSAQAWVAKNIKYPLDAQQNKIEGKVYISFIINQDGSVCDVKVIRSVCPSIDQEGIRVIESMPKWEPGILQGNPVRVQYTMPINFKLNP